MSNTPTYAEPEEVMALVRDPNKIAGKDYVIIDVRGDDYIVSLHSTFLFFFFHSSLSLGWTHSRLS